MQDDILTPEAVAEFLHIPRRQVYPFIASLPAGVRFRLGKRVRVWRKALIVWIASQGQPESLRPTGGASA